jgi:hypothetical protein
LEIHALGFVAGLNLTVIRRAILSMDDHQDPLAMRVVVVRNPTESDDENDESLDGT